MSEICDSCSASYDYIYWVPDHVWEKIRPLDSGHGGLLCLRCVHRRSNEAGFVLRFSGSDNWWITDELTAAKADNQCWEMAVAELNRTISKQQAENEKLRGRVAELIAYIKEEVADGHTYKDYQNILEGDRTEVWFLRKQAETMDECVRDLQLLPEYLNFSEQEMRGFKCAIQHCRGEAATFRQQAYELEHPDGRS